VPAPGVALDAAEHQVEHHVVQDQRYPADQQPAEEVGPKKIKPPLVKPFVSAVPQVVPNGLIPKPGPQHQ
jgi:hypothetical protein